MRGRVGLLGHEPLLYRELTARENLRFHARLHDLSAERVEERLAAVALTDRAEGAAEDAVPRHGGSVWRSPRATLHDPELLLLDEPWANLDPAARELIEPLIGASARRTRVISSHDPSGGLSEADLVLGLRAGRPALLRDAERVDPSEIAELYR